MSMVKSPEIKPRLPFRAWIWVAAALLLLAGLGLRLIAFDNPPLDLHAWRQLRSANIARAIYYRALPQADPEVRALANYLGSTYQVLEPNIFEHLVGYTYLLAGEELLPIARLYSILFWLGGGLALFDLMRRMTGPWGALAGLAYFLFLPFGVQHSRAFLPEPLMILFILLTLWASYRWVETGSGWKWALAAGLFAGLAILVKVYAVFTLVPGLALLLLSGLGLRRLLRSRSFWMALVLAIAIPAIYYLILAPGGGGAGYLQTWSLPYLPLLKDPLFYLAWLHKLTGALNPVFLYGGLLGALLLPKSGRWMALGLWIGYVVEGCTVPSLIRSHSYYNMPLVAMVALGVAPLGAIIQQFLARQGWVWRMLAVGVLLAGLADTTFIARKPLVAEDYRAEPAFWQDLDRSLPTDGTVIALTEDYNTRLHYYGWRYAKAYLYADDFDMMAQGGRSVDLSGENLAMFLDQVEGQDYFLITKMDELERQPYLKTILNEFYPLVMQSERVLLYDLRHPLKPLEP
jgi:hypothetical protein